MPETTEKTFGSDFVPIARRQLPMFFMIDTSGSMDGAKIGTIDTTMRELLPELVGMGEADADIRIAILTFSSGCEWMTTAPQQPEDIVWRKPTADGLTDLGDACKELSKKMSRKEFLASPGSTFAPIVILLTDGEPTDNYKQGLEVLWANNWFKNAIKLALPIGSGVTKEGRDLLAEFTGNPEAVLKNVNSAAQLKKMLKMVSVTSATIGSRSSINPETEEENGNVENPQEGSSAKMTALLDEIKTVEDDSSWSAPSDGVDMSAVGYEDDEW